MKETTSEQLRDRICDITGWIKPPPLSTLCGWTHGGIEMLSDPLCDLNACAGLIEHLSDWTCVMSKQTAGWRCAFNRYQNGIGYSYAEHATSLAVAICLAFVKTMEGEK